MKIIFETEDRKFEANVEYIEDILYIVEDCLVAMGYAKETAKQAISELFYEK